MENVLQENSFLVFGRKVNDVAWFIGYHFETVRPIFDIFATITFCFVLFFEYYISDSNFQILRQNGDG